MDKAMLRARMRGFGIVEPRTGEMVAEGLRSWLAARLPGTVAAYLAMTDEVEVSGLFTALPGWQWVLPRVEPDGELTFRDRDVPREVHRLGKRQPEAAGETVPVNELDVLLLPGLAFDPTGARLGRGGGYYDRLLAEVRRDCVTIGVTISSRVVPQIPMEPHDRRVGWLATETGVKECSPRR